MAVQQQQQSAGERADTTQSSKQSGTITLTEDDIYRASTQFRQWSFSPESLAALRATTNRTAAEHVRSVAAVAVSQSPDAVPPTVAPLTPIEELALLLHHVRHAALICSHLALPSSVAFTALTYLKRFYLGNSLMTHHPRQVVPACIFLATKTENFYVGLTEFVRRMREAPVRWKWKVPGNSSSASATAAPSGDASAVGLGIGVRTEQDVGEEEIKRNEMVLVRGLRYCFEVKQPRRGLAGGLMELLALSRGQSLGASSETERAQQQLQTLPPPRPWTDKKGREHRVTSPQDSSSSAAASYAEHRMSDTHEHAREILSDIVPLTDASFLYTPAQVWLAALAAADDALAHWYLDLKLQGVDPAIQTKITTAVRGCTALIEGASTSHQANDGGTQESEAAGEMTDPVTASRAALRAIDKKLHGCTRLLEEHGAAAAQQAALAPTPGRAGVKREKHEGAANGSSGHDANGDGRVGTDTQEIDENEDSERARLVKKRRLERERSAKDADVFG